MTTTKTLKTAAVAFAATFAMAIPAQAGDAFAKSLDLADASASAVQTLIDECQSNDSTSRAVLACTKLMRLAPAADDQARVMTRRGQHRLAAGKLQAAAADFRRAGEISGNQRLASLGAGFAAVDAQDLVSARSEFEDCSQQAALAPLAHYGLGLTHQMAGRADEARSAYAQALELRPDWDVAAARIASLG